MTFNILEIGDFIHPALPPVLFCFFEILFVRVMNIVCPSRGPRETLLLLAAQRLKKKGIAR